MSARTDAAGPSRAALRLLALIAARKAHAIEARDSAAADELIRLDLACREASGRLAISASGLAHLARRQAGESPHMSRYRAQHLQLDTARIDIEGLVREVLVDGAESPLAWLARRKGRDGRAMIAPVQLIAGERLRADFTRAQMSPRVTSNWSASVSSGRRGGAAGECASDLSLAARQRVRAALRAVGLEFAGPLLDVCCFLQGLEEVERARGWPPRSAKVVLQLGLDRLARHYGLGAQAGGPARADVLTWLAEDAAFTV